MLGVTVVTMALNVSLKKQTKTPKTTTPLYLNVALIVWCIEVGFNGFMAREAARGTSAC